MKTTTYSWRVTVERRARLETMARKAQRPVAQLLDDAVDRLFEEDLAADVDAEQQVRAAAMAAVGRVAGGDPDRATESKARVRELLRRRRAGGR